jgi:hypothetical protein
MLGTEQPVGEGLLGTPMVWNGAFSSSVSANDQQSPAWVTNQGNRRRHIVETLFVNRQRSFQWCTGLQPATSVSPDLAPGGHCQTRQYFVFTRTLCGDQLQSVPLQRRS